MRGGLIYLPLAGGMTTSFCICTPPSRYLKMVCSPRCCDFTPHLLLRGILQTVGAQGKFLSMGQPRNIENWDWWAWGRDSRGEMIKMTPKSKGYYFLKLRSPLGSFVKAELQHTKECGCLHFWSLLHRKPIAAQAPSDSLPQAASATPLQHSCPRV